MTSLGGRALHHGDNDEVEQEYDRLRDAARAEAEKRNDCFERSRRAYEDGDGARAKELSNEGKAHQAKMADYNRQASEYIFRENNAPDRVEEDCIDLHGQFVEEAERIVEARIMTDQDAGRTHLHVIVGKGNHSANHVTKIKPKVEEVCRRMGLNYHVEENAGRIYVNLQGGEAIPPPRPDYHQGPPQPQQPPPQQAPEEDVMDDLVGLIFGKLRQVCCAVM
ncbi:Smr domain-containing protein [Escovopsis weberi]|uniref:Smr domain-containing protein n=1 Tax=Escovopsis weberi TaxID=150374 RepID=A0A0M9VT97_ESCWE|nr:Smr domain-containing protein [Escovopsis weberi]